VTGGLHHVELWVADLDAAVASWGWLLGELGWTEYQRWEHGRSWRYGDGPYLVVERSPALGGNTHDRMLPGLNHLALRAGSRNDVERLVRAAGRHGWTPVYPEPFVGAAAYLADPQAFEVELAVSG
jgi:catechol 2,3-dioxygenase-like lactoylglutathione lyase family enzyme